MRTSNRRSSYSSNESYWFGDLQIITLFKTHGDYTSGKLIL